MASYSITFKRSVTRDLRSIPTTDVQRILARIDSRADEPRARGCTKLSGTREYYRVRVGAYRILYEIRDSALVINVVKIGHRSAVYR